MVRTLPETGGEVVALQLTHKLDDAAYDTIIPLLENAIREHGKIRLYWEMHDFEGWTAHALLSDARFDSDHANDFTKIAMVGEKAWHEWMTKLMKPFTSAEVRYFDLSERDDALGWVQQPAGP